MSQTVRTQLIQLLTPVVEEFGFDLVDLEYAHQKRWVVRVYIDRPNLPIIPELGVAPGEGVNLDECTQVSRQISAVLDVEDLVPHHYDLEVSSPGVQRPLRRQQDFERFRGCPVRVKTFEPIQSSETDTKSKPRRNVLGTLTDSDETTITLQDQDQIYHIPLDKIARAHLEPDMDRWMSVAKQSRAVRGE